MQLSWSKAAGDQWCLLEDGDSIPVSDYGVFVIWRHGDVRRPSSVLYVGRGGLAHEVGRCRRDPLFHTADVRITWAAVQDVRLIEGIAAYVYRQLRPMWGEVVPWSQPVTANLPAA